MKAFRVTHHQLFCQNCATQCWRDSTLVINLGVLTGPAAKSGPTYMGPAIEELITLFICGFSWWRHQMETFSALLAICAGNSPVPGEFPTQRPVTRSCDVFFDLRLNKRLSKQWWGWWFETLSRPLWRHRNVCQKQIFRTCVSNYIPQNTVVCNYLFIPKYSYNPVYHFDQSRHVAFNKIILIETTWLRHQTDLGGDEWMTLVTQRL